MLRQKNVELDQKCLSEPTNRATEDLGTSSETRGQELSNGKGFVEKVVLWRVVWVAADPNFDTSYLDQYETSHDELGRGDVWNIAEQKHVSDYL